MTSDAAQAEEPGAGGASKWGIWAIVSNVAFGVVIGTVVIIVSISRGQPIGIAIGVFMMIVGGYYAWRAWQGRQTALRHGRRL